MDRHSVRQEIRRAGNSWSIFLFLSGDACNQRHSRGNSAQRMRMHAQYAEATLVLPTHAQATTARDDASDIELEETGDC